MKLSFNGATTMKADLPTDIRAAGETGFDYVEIWAAKLRRYLREHSTGDLKKLFDDDGIEPLSINSIEHITFRAERDYDRIKAECEQLCGIAAAIDCPYVVVVPGKLPPRAVTRDQIINESVRVLNELSEIAGPHDVSLGFEFLGQTDCSVQTLDLADEIVKRVNRNNIGLVLDAFHFYAGGSTIEMIEALDPKRLFIFHIDDAEDLPREKLTDAHRLLPGIGILPLREIINAFRRIGYDANASVELFRPEYWERDAFEFAHEAKAAVESVLDQEPPADSGSLVP
jgi:2-keto-myo-inositol isomerase